ncbi:MAG: glycosyl transferase family 2, partial [Deltaproteobacteria bacterium]
VKRSEALETFGYEGTLEPEPVNVNLDLMIDLFKTGYKQFSPLWEQVFSRDCFDQIAKVSKLDSDHFHFSTEMWVKLLYELAATFHLWSVNRHKLVDMMTPLYFARVASFVRQSWDMSIHDAEALVEEQALRFEEQKEYLIKVWDQKSAEKAKAEKAAR